MVAESDQQNHPPAPVLSGADRLRLRREAYLKARSGETTSSVELFEDLQPAPAPRVAHRAPQQQARNGSMAPKNLPGRNGSIRGHDSSGTTDRAGSVPAGSSTENGLRRVLMTSIEEPMQSMLDDEDDFKNSNQSGHRKRRLSSVTSSQLGETKKLKTKESAHIPKKEKGAIAVPDPDIDMVGAILGQPDPSKFCIAFDTLKPHPEIEGRYVQGKRVEYDLREIDSREFDFNNKDDIKRINVWRRQILGRNFPKMRKTRQFWLESEKEYVIYLVTKQLKKSVHIKWRRLANQFNAHFQGSTQRAGEKLLLSGRQKMGVITEDRPAPWRTSPAIQGQASKWQDLKEIIRRAENKASEKVSDDEGSGSESEGGSSPDEDEVPDPNPHPSPTVTPRKYPRYSRSQTPAVAKSSSPLKKGEAAEDVVETEVGGESSDSDEVLL